MISQKTQITFTLVFIVLCTFNAYAAPGDFYLDSNGITIRCDNAVVGDTGMVDGTTYTKISVSSDLILNGGTVDAIHACTSSITYMGGCFIPPPPSIRTLVAGIQAV